MYMWCESCVSYAAWCSHLKETDTVWSLIHFHEGYDFLKYIDLGCGFE